MGKQVPRTLNETSCGARRAQAGRGEIACNKQTGLERTVPYTGGAKKKVAAAGEKPSLVHDSRCSPEEAWQVTLEIDGANLACTEDGPLGGEELHDCRRCGKSIGGNN